MASSLLTINMVTREAVQLFLNTNSFIQHIDRQYDDQFANTGAKIGQTLRIRLPNDYTVGDGPAISIQDTQEQSTTLSVATQKNVAMSFTTADRTMSLDDYSRRVMAPAINVLVGKIAQDVMSGVNGGICNYQANLDGAGNIQSPTAQTWLNAGALLDINSTPMDNRLVVQDPFTEARMITSLSGLLNPVDIISGQYKTARMKEGLGYKWMKDQTVLKHLSGSFTTGTVAGASQTGTTLLVSAIAGNLELGAIITLANVNAVNFVTKATTGQLRQFVVQVAAPAGSTQLTIFPAIIPAVGGNDVQYQTVDASPANGATVTKVDTFASAGTTGTYRKNFAFSTDAVTMVTADLEMPEKGVVESARESFDGISLRMITAYNVLTDQAITRLDCLYGYLWIRPQWACIVPDVI